MRGTVRGNAQDGQPKLMSNESVLQALDPNEFARGLFQESNDALLLFSPRTLGLIDANPTAQRLIGGSRETLLSRQISDLFIADEVSIEDLLISCRTGKLIQAPEAYRLLTGDDGPLDVSVTLSRLDLQPESVGVISIRDITFRRQLELNLQSTQSLLMATINNQASNLDAATAELRSSQQRMHELLKDVDAVVWEADLPSFRFSYVSSRAEKMLGYPIEQWLEEASFLLNHMHPDDVEVIRGYFDGSLRIGHDQEFDFRAITADDRIVWLRNTMHVVKDAEQNPVMLRGVMTDITTRVRANQKLQSLERELTHVSRLSTLGAMVAGIAHEVNQPLSAISNFASAAHNELGALEVPEDSPLMEWMEQIRDQAIRCGDIIRGMRDFTRKGGSQVGSVDFQRVVSDSLAILQANRSHHPINLDIRVPETLVCVAGNATELQQVLVNLLSNARESLAESKPELPTIGIHVEVDADRLIVRVSDNGAGVSQDILPRLFDPFFTTRDDGLGVGLAISRTIIENHGGELSVESNHRPGACFRFELPLDPS